MKHNKQVLEPTSQTSIHIDFNACSFVSLICIRRLRNVIEISSEFLTDVHWVLKCTHVMWYAFTDWLRYFMNYEQV